MTIFKKLRFLAASALLAVASVAQAQVNPGGNPGGGVNPGGNPETTEGPRGLVNPLGDDVETLPQFLEAILKGVVDIGTIILIMMLVYVGFLFVAARGNAEKLQSAKSALVWTVVGGLILLGATAIQMVITETVKSLN